MNQLCPKCTKHTLTQWCAGCGWESDVSDAHPPITYVEPTQLWVQHSTDNRTVRLSPREFQMYTLLTEARGEVVPDSVYPNSHAALKVRYSKLRIKTGRQIFRDRSVPGYRMPVLERP